MTENYIAEAITIAYGERCPTTVRGCPVCDAWAQYDAIKLFVDLIASLSTPISSQLSIPVDKDT